MQCRKPSNIILGEEKIVYCTCTRIGRAHRKREETWPKRWLLRSRGRACDFDGGGGKCQRARAHGTPLSPADRITQFQPLTARYSYENARDTPLLASSTVHGGVVVGVHSPFGPARKRVHTGTIADAPWPSLEWPFAGHCHPKNFSPCCTKRTPRPSSPGTSPVVLYTAAASVIIRSNSGTECGGRGRLFRCSSRPSPQTRHCSRRLWSSGPPPRTSNTRSPPAWLLSVSTSNIICIQSRKSVWYE